VCGFALIPSLLSQLLRLVFLFQFMDVLEATVLVSPDVLVLQTVVRLGGLVFLAESLGAHFVSFVGRSRECTTITSRNDGKNCVDL
jgi:hypothetical protein